MNDADQDHWAGHAIRDLTIDRVLRRQVERYGDKCYLHDLESGIKYSYRDIDRESARIANGLLAQGIGKGQHVAVLMANSTSCLFSFFALGRIGAVAVPVHAGARGQLLAYLLETADVVAAIADSEAAERILQVADALPDLTKMFVLGAMPSSGNGEGLRLLPFSALESDDASAPGVDVGHDDPAYILFTSGTTGPSKGNLFVQATCFLWESAVPELCDGGPDDTYYFAISMSHAAGLFGIAYLMLALGGTVAFRPQFSASRFIEDVRESGATLAQLLGAMFSFIERQPETDQDADTALRVILGGPLPPDPKAFERRFGVKLCQGYGLSDHSSCIKFRPGSRSDKLGSIGQALPQFEVRIADDADFEVPVGTPGEILLRTRVPWYCSSGYYRNPEASMAARRNDWFHTGDRGYVDEDGYFWFLNRIKDSIRRRGENVSAYEVELILQSHPDVSDAAAFAVPSAAGEDEVAAVVVPVEGAQLQLENVIAHCRREMPPYMVPSFLRELEDLPRTVTQRVEKYKLRAMFDDAPGTFENFPVGSTRTVRNQ